jgi:hypothetical protein
LSAKKKFNKFEEPSEELSTCIAIILTDRRGGILNYAIIDKEDLYIVNDRHWHLTKSGYARSSDTYNKVFMHNLILGFCPSTKLVVDHINRNPLDNRKHNLRIVSHQTNLQNRGKFKTNRSGETGICLETARNKWRLQINGRFYGRYDTLEDAVEAKKHIKEE